MDTSATTKPVREGVTATEKALVLFKRDYVAYTANILKPPGTGYFSGIRHWNFVVDIWTESSDFDSGWHHWP